MGTITVTCPMTGEPIRFELDTSYRRLAKTWDKKLKIDCPHCRRVHEMKVREAFIASTTWRD